MAPHQPLAGNVADAVRNSEVDQARLFLTADDFHPVPEELLGSSNEFGTVACLPQSIGTDDTQTGRRNVAQSLAKTREAVECPLLRFSRQPVMAVETRGELNHFAQAVENLHVPVGDAGNDHVKAVRTEVDRRDKIRRHLRIPR